MRRELSVIADHVRFCTKVILNIFFLRFTMSPLMTCSMRTGQRQKNKINKITFPENYWAYFFIIIYKDVTKMYLYFPVFFINLFESK